jgi:hypothetical protein
MGRSRGRQGMITRLPVHAGDSETPGSTLPAKIRPSVCSMFAEQAAGVHRAVGKSL